MFNDASAISINAGPFYPARRGSLTQEGTAQIAMGNHNMINHTCNVYSSNTTVTTNSPIRPLLPATPPPSLLYLRGTPQQQYQRLANSPKRVDSLPDEVLVSPTVENGRFDGLLALTNRTDPSGMRTTFSGAYSAYSFALASQAVSDLVHDLSKKFILTGTTPSIPASANLESQQRRAAANLLLHLAKLGE